MQNSIKYRYAYNQENEITDISLASRKETYFCISCGNILIPKLGSNRLHHFAHKFVTQGCSSETYLHKLAKTIFFTEYKKCLLNEEPFYIEYLTERKCIDVFSDNNRIEWKRDNYKSLVQKLMEADKLDNNYSILENIKAHTCKKIYENKIFDLTTSFKEIKLEEYDNGFIPDILLIGKNGEKIYVEIFVSHKSEKGKIASNERIMEIKISKEDDILPILDHFIPNSTKRINFYNFNIPLNHKLCNDCNVRGHIFQIYKSKKAFLKNGSLLEYFEENNKKHSTVYSQFIFEDNYYNDFYGDTAYIEEVINAFKTGIDVIDCNLCKYAGDVKYGLALVFCKFLREHKHSQFAVDCQYFRVRKDLDSLE